MTSNKRLMNLKLAVLCILPLGVRPAFGDSYDSLLKRYEKQIHQQERQLKNLHARLDEKARDATRWQAKAETAKAAWSEASASYDQIHEKIKVVHLKRQQTRLLADAAQWKTTENVLLSRSAVTQAKALAQDLYATSLVMRTSSRLTVEEEAPQVVFTQMARLSASSQVMAEEAQKEESALRTDEMRWQTEEQARSSEADRLHENQEAQWLKWQEALRRKTALEDEISQIDQSAKALQVMLQELHSHRDQARALRENRSDNEAALASLRGSFPWPAHGKVVQNYGRQYSDGLNQLVVSNGVKIETGPNHTVRVIQEGKVLFSDPFRQYGQLVIIQHKNSLTSVYAGLGTTQVKVGQVLAALDQIGSVGESGSFYFELRHDEQPVNPLVYLTPVASSKLSSSRRNF